MNQIKISIVLLISILFFSCSKEDEKSFAFVDGMWTYVVLDSEAEALDGDPESIFASANVNYPEEAREQGIEGKVILDYIINEEGIVENFDINLDLGGGCGEAALTAFQVFEGQTLFSPAIYQGNPVKTYGHVPIDFKLE